MSFDGMMTRAITKELQAFVGGRINKIHQPFKTELVMTIRAGGKNHSLLASANATFARIHVTEEKYENPSEPPMFCMLLRKHIEGGFISAIEQDGFDRVITFTIANKDELGDRTEKQIIFEIMGRHSNIILIDKKNQVILDSIKHVRFDQSSYRTVGPGQPYKKPPEQDKADPLDATEEDVLRKIDFNAGKLDKQLVQQFAGISPLLANEVLARAKMANRSTLPAAFVQLMQQIKEHDYTPELVRGEKEFFSIISLTHKPGERLTFSSASQLLDRFYYGKAERDRVKQQAYDLERLLKNEYQKNVRKQKKLSQTLREADEAATYQKLGELLTANMYAIKKGDHSIEVVDYYDETGKTIRIELDPQKTASENAQQYFKKYQKAKTARLEVVLQVEKTNEELAYLDSLLQQMDSASSRDVADIRDELAEGGYIRKKQVQGKKKKKQSDKPIVETYRSTTGVEFLVGKNNRQNDYLTNRLARQDEIWLHTKDIPGSHVVIRHTEPDETTLAEAALVAAYYSKARESSSVPVDFTKIRHVKKPSGAKPGYVTYDQQTTLFVTPVEDDVRALRVT
ncbi:putative ribosome quality control (RQC) complex YloA/Tae2 family protein [Alkalihalobacillus xiaoxiensis]|uniref:Rqc2 homolog RqcH n=1 Tax=Shouchella xiaoxiensis TaxID=766895 RepID=A0ABS2SQX3_9BACI|nr:NFACT RNA binding domain-containing protein [Shouchella xiaoxiensis]MBM7837586.1 putative ribosome quality control (RQC) complex YloA/Tae2 family protein [Shouchella xiaoxiensis]